MLFLLTLAAFGACLLAVFGADRAQEASRRRRQQPHHESLPPPSGRPVPVSPEPERNRDRAPEGLSMR